MEASERIFELEKKVQSLELAINHLQVDVEEMRTTAGRVSVFQIDPINMTAKKKKGG